MVTVHSYPLAVAMCVLSAVLLGLWLLRQSAVLTPNQSEAELLTGIKVTGAAAALSVTRLGAQPSAPARRQVLALLGRG